MIAGIGTYVIYLLVFTFLFPGISWTGHVGGLLVGAVLGFFLPPVGVATLAGMWRTPAGEPVQRSMPILARAAVYVGVAVVLAVGWFVAVDRFIG
jgi:hypothetical protein